MSRADGAFKTNDVKIALIIAGHSSRGERAALGERVQLPENGFSLMISGKKHSRTASLHTSCGFRHISEPSAKTAEDVLPREKMSCMESGFAGNAPVPDHASNLIIVATIISSR